MRKVSISICTLLVSLSLAACKEKAPDTTADAQAIKDNEATWVKDWQAKDVDKITSHYAPDAVLMVANMPAMKGIRRDQIRHRPDAQGSASLADVQLPRP